MLHITGMWAGMFWRDCILCAASSETSLVTYALYCVYESREESALVHNLLWAFVGHVCFI